MGSGEAGEKTGPAAPAAVSESTTDPDEAEAPEDGESEGDELGPQCLWFFLPLPHPLGIPHGATFAEILTPKEEFESAEPTSGLRYSLMVHQTARAENLLEAELRTMSATAIAAVAERNRDEVEAAFQAQAASTPGLGRSTMTLIEVAIPIGEREPDQALVGELLDVALDSIRYLQRGVAAVTQQPVRLISRATLPPLITVFGGRLHYDGDRPTFTGAIPHTVVGAAPPATYQQEPNPLTAAQLEGLHIALGDWGTGSVYSVYADMRREALVQRHFDGNPRMTVLALASAGEVFLDSTLLHMVWEEKLPIPDAAGLFDRHEGHTHRVAVNFPARLGGHWDPNGTGAVADYFTHLVNLRHRVVHAGHNPTDDEVAKAWEGLFNLEHFIGDRLAAGATLNRFPRTAFNFLGERGLRRRGRWTRRIQELTADTREPPWGATFGRYRLHVDRELDQAARPPGAAPDELVLYATKEEDGVDSWAVHDPAIALAATVNPEDLMPAERIEHTRAMLEALAEGGEATPRVMIQFDPATLPNVLDWRRDDELFSDLYLYPGRVRPATPAAGDS